MQSILERGRDAEIATAAADGPEEGGVGLRADVELLAVGRDDLRRNQVIARGAVLRHEHALTAAQGETRDADSWASSCRGGETEALSGDIELHCERAALGTRDTLVDVHVHLIHSTDIDDYTAVTHAEARPVVSAGADGQRQ